MDGGLSILDALKLVAPEKILKWQGWSDKLASQDIETVADLWNLRETDYEKLTQVCTPLLSSTLLLVRENSHALGEGKNETHTSPEEELAVRDQTIETLLGQLEDLKALVGVKDRDMEEMSVIFDEMNTEKETASAAATQFKTEVEALREQLAQAQSEAANHRKQGAAGQARESFSSGASSELASRLKERGANDVDELEKLKAYRAARAGRYREASDALREASNWFQQDLEMSKKDFRLEQLEGSLAKMEMELQSAKTKCNKLQLRVTLLEETNNELMKTKNVSTKEITMLTKECTNLQKLLSQAQSPGNSEVGRESQMGGTVNARERLQVMDGMVTGEETYGQELKALVAFLSNPVLLPKARKEITAIANCLQSLSVIQQGLKARFHEARAKNEKAFLECVETITVQTDPYYHQYVGLLSGLRASGVYEDLAKALQSGSLKPLEGPLCRTALYASALMELHELTSPTHPYAESLSSVYALCQSRAASLQKTQATALQSAGLLLLQSKIHSIPDGFELVKAARVFQEETMMYLLLHPPSSSSGGAEMRPPSVASHPITSKDLESVRIFLFNDNLLITTFHYKYRYRIELHDSQLTKPGDHTLVLKPELLTSDDIKEVQEESEGITTLLCSSTAERDVWATKIRVSMETRKKEIGQKLIAKSTRNSRNSVFGGNNGNLNSSSGSSSNEGVRVFLRVRPFVMEVEKTVGEICLSVEGNIARLDQKSLDEWREDRVGYFEKIYGPESTQADVFGDVGRPVAESCVLGVNSAVLCYGNTGAGKTYTMLGSSSKSGLLPRTITAILAPRTNMTVSVFMGYVQVYNGRVDDLCVEGREILKDKAGRYSTIHFGSILNSKQAMMVLLKGNELRATRSHNMNGQSSRSHAICILRVKAVSKLDGKTLESTVQLVDLAGSENTVATGVSGEGVKEAIEINKSLISLGRVINALNENTKRTKGKQIPVPFRESPLTVILRDVLEGEFLCHVVLNCSCSPALEQARQTAKTFAFAEGLRKLASHKKEVKEAKEGKSPRVGGHSRTSSLMSPKTFLR